MKLFGSTGTVETVANNNAIDMEAITKLVAQEVAKYLKK